MGRRGDGEKRRKDKEKGARKKAQGSRSQDQRSREELMGDTGRVQRCCGLRVENTGGRGLRIGGRNLKC